MGYLDKYIYAINADGNLQWRHITRDFVLSSPAIGADSTLYVGSHDGYVYAIGD
ncbi:MAG: PQQ-binding-like beta-propeller repeat protein [Dehalococcoidia bacterium]|nr:MAG: PQQ-binding-like beta-propeller repeat protein [Dehalococcoidia bacterium]